MNHRLRRNVAYMAFAVCLVAVSSTTAIAQIPMAMSPSENTSLKDLPQSCGYVDPPPRLAVGVDGACRCGRLRAPWLKNQRLIEWSKFHQGEYAGPARTPHVGEYRVRVDDSIDFIYRVTRERSSRPYNLAVGDLLNIQLLQDETITRDLEVQPDGTLFVPLLGRVMAADRTVEQLQRDLTNKFKDQYKNPIVVITPVRVNTRLEDLRATVDRRAGRGGQSQAAVVTPEGTIQLPGIGSVCVQGLTIPEIKEEVDARYDQLFGGLEVTPILIQRAPRYIYVLGEVAQPGRFEMTGPTTLMQSIALAGGWNNGANLRQIVVFRRAENWRLTAAIMNVERALYGADAYPRDEIWLRDADVIVVAKTPLRVLDDAIQLAFTEGLYRIFPVFGGGFGNLNALSSIN